MNNRVSAVVVGIVISIGLLYVHPAYAHNFASDESAHFLGKVVNLEAEMQALKMDLSDPTAVSWHISKINSYWTTNDTQQMAERNQLLSNEIPKTINDIITAARAPSPDSGTISQQIDALNGYLDEGIPVRIDKDKMQNGTVQALADTDIIKETLADYGIAINSQVDLNDMSKMESMGSMSMGANQTSSSSAGAGSSGQTIMMSKGAGSGQACVSSKNCFDPSTLTVSPGDTVTWKNMDTVSHTVTSGNPTDNQTGTVFDSGLVKPGDTFTFTFKDAGTYHYFCQVHPWMTGMVVVGQGGMSGMKMGTSYSQNDAAPIHLVQMSGMSSSGSMSGMGGTSGGGSGMNMQSSSATTVTISNMAAYHSAQTHAQAMKSFFDKNVAPLANSTMATQVQTADTYMGKLIDAIDSKDDGNTIMVITHLHIHPALITAFNLPLMKMSMNMGNSAVPEFPVPALLALVSVIGVVAITRFRTKLN